MKNRLNILILVLPVLLFSCGGESTTEDSENTKTEVTRKTTSLSDKDNMMARLGELNIKLPAEMDFVEIKKNSGEYTAHFIATDLDEAASTKLTEWYEEQCQAFATDGFIRRNIQDNEEMMGMIINHDIFISSSDGIDFSSVLDPNEKTFKVYIQP